MYTPQIETHAAVSFTVAAGVVTIISNTGKILSVTSGAPGVVDVTLQPNEGIDDSLRFVAITPLGATAAIPTFDRLNVATTDTNLRINTFDAAGVAADADLNVVIFKKRTV